MIADGTERIETSAEKIRTECRNVGNGFFAFVSNDGVERAGKGEGWNQNLEAVVRAVSQLRFPCLNEMKESEFAVAV